MLTVIIAESDMLVSIDKYKLFIAPLMRSSNIICCHWDRDALNISDMCENIHGCLKGVSEWRAVIVYSDGRYKKNPFDYTEYTEKGVLEAKTDWEYIQKRLKDRLEVYQKAIDNPFTRLCSALCGRCVSKDILDDDTYEAAATGSLRISELMLRRTLEDADIIGLLDSIKKSRTEDVLKNIVDADVLKRRDAKEIISVIGEDKVTYLISLLTGNDPKYTDPSYTSALVENTMKVKLFDALAGKFDFNDILPAEVICMAARTYDSTVYDNYVSWKHKDEREYSRFCEFNMYPDALRFVLFDIADDSHRLCDYDMLRYINLIILFAMYSVPSGAMSKNRVYKAKCEYKADRLSFMLGEYSGKLKKTHTMLLDMEQKAIEDDNRIERSDTVDNVLRSEANIPVQIPQYNTEGNLLADPSPIGLTRDCPINEKIMFDNQYTRIKKNFKYYLKLPRRALESASRELREKNKIDGEDCAYLAPDQADDLSDMLDDTEREIMSATTGSIYAGKKYNKLISQAAEDVQKEIERRTNRKPIVIGGIIALVLFIVSFIPLILTSATLGNTLYAVVMMLLSTGSFVIIAVIALILKKNELKKKFDSFNSVMRNILADIKKTMDGFSVYLSHVCKFMQGTYVQRQITEHERLGKRRIRILKMHMNDIRVDREEIQLLFGTVELDIRDSETCSEYDYDFSLPLNYTYTIPNEGIMMGKIAFLQEDNIIEVPVDYLNDVTLTREELYDA